MIEEKEEIAKIGTNLKTVRTSKGLSLTELSKLSGVNSTTLAAIENGSYDPMLSQIITLAFRLNVDFRKIMVDCDLY